LIATACGLGIAIFTLIPFNYFTGKVVRLQFELETAATNVEVMLNPAKMGAISTPERVPPPKVRGA
jgi:biopolymer transport protein ExbB